jgi:hypothetical protein
MNLLQEWIKRTLAISYISEVNAEVCGGQTHTIVKYGDRSPNSFRGGTCARAWLPRMRHVAGDDRAGLKVDEPSEVK